MIDSSGARSENKPAQSGVLGEGADVRFDERGVDPDRFP
jgi:hypothetical protein